MGHIITMFLNIHSCIQCETLTHIRHVNISSSIMRLSTMHDSKTHIRGYPPEPISVRQVFPTLTRFGFSPISQHEYGMDNRDIGTHPECIPKPVSNVENYLIAHWDLPCYNNFHWNLNEQTNYSVKETLKWACCWIMHYNIAFGDGKTSFCIKKNDSLRGWGWVIPKPVGEGDAIQFLIPVWYE